MNIESSANRVAKNTDPQVNEQIRRATEARILHYSLHPEQIQQRLDELDQEWDIERTLQANAATLAFTGTAFGILFGKKWLLLPAVVTGFLLQHSLQGWCPPLPIFRRLGFRTPQEIEHERYALKALRGDFQNLSSTEPSVPQVLQAVQS